MSIVFREAKFGLTLEQPVIRPTEKDFKILLGLDEKCFDPAAARFSHRGMGRYLLTSTAIIAEDEGIPVAFVILEVKKKVSYLVKIGVVPEYRRQKIAENLIAWVLYAAKQSGLVRLHVNSENDSAIAFYEKLGFHKRSFRPNFYADRVDAIEYEKKLI